MKTKDMEQKNEPKPSWIANIISRIKSPKQWGIRWQVGMPALVVLLGVMGALVGSLLVAHPAGVGTIESPHLAKATHSPSSNVSPSPSSPTKVNGPSAAPYHSQPMVKVNFCSGSGQAISQNLLDQSSNAGSVVSGYGMCAKVSRAGLWRIPSAEAASTSFTPIIFYIKPVNGINQVFVYSTSTKTETQMTTETGRGALKPVFSTQSQHISYAHVLTNPDGTSRSDLVIGDVSTGQTQAVVAGKNDSYKPEAWSPNGSKLLYALMDNTIPPPNGPLIKLYLYDLASSTSSEIVPPAGYNGEAGFGNVVWRNNSTLDIKFADHAGGAYNNPHDYLVDIGSKTMTPIDSFPTYDIASIQEVSSQLYAGSTTTPNRKLLMAPAANPSQAQAIAGTDSIGSFLLKLNDSGDTVTGIVFMAGLGGQLGGVSIKSVPAGGGTAQALFTTPGYSAVMIGWGKDYDSVLWLSADSGKSSVHLFNLSTTSDSVLIDGLDLVQG